MSRTVCKYNKLKLVPVPQLLLHSHLVLEKEDKRCNYQIALSEVFRDGICESLSGIPEIKYLDMECLKRHIILNYMLYSSIREKIYYF